MENLSNVDERYRLWWLMARARDTMKKTRDRELRKFGLSYQGSGVLFLITVLGDDATISEISRWLFREPHSVAELVARMEKQGLLRRRKNRNRRGFSLVLTAKGKQLYERAAERVSIYNIVSVLSERERSQLTELLEKMRNRAVEELHIHRIPPWP